MRRPSRLALLASLVLALVVAGLGHVLPLPAEPASIHAAHESEGCCPDMAADNCRDMHGTHVCCLLPEPTAMGGAARSAGPCWSSPKGLRAVVVAPQPRPPNASIA